MLVSSLSLPIIRELNVLFIGRHGGETKARKQKQKKTLDEAVKFVNYKLLKPNLWTLAFLLSYIGTVYQEMGDELYIQLYK